MDKQLIVSTIIVLIGIAIRLVVRYLVHIRPELKRWKLVERWEKVIALVNQFRKDYLKKFPKEQKPPYENIIEKVKEFSAMFGVNVADVTAHRRKIKDAELNWSTVDIGGESTAELSFKVNDKQIDPDTAEA